MLLCRSPAGLAEKADHAKPVNIEADRMTVDDNKQVSLFEGKVVITQGTLQLRAQRVTVQQDAKGFQFGVAVGNPATFRQKREGADEWIEGEAERIEYDGKKELVEFFNRARLRRKQDEVRGNYISYDSKTEFFRVQSAKDATDPAGAASQDSRVRAVIQPKEKDKGDAKPAPAHQSLELQSSPKLNGPQVE
jgi:lipopolysaccharide export system protein LptA